jgi:hypothetical protein
VINASYREQVRVHGDFARFWQCPIVVPVVADALGRKATLADGACGRHDTRAQRGEQSDKRRAERTGKPRDTL